MSKNERNFDFPFSIFIMMANVIFFLLSFFDIHRDGEYQKPFDFRFSIFNIESNVIFFYFRFSIFIRMANVKIFFFCFSFFDIRV